MIHALGWTWSQAEAELDLHRLAALTRHWTAHPPVHLLVAAYLKYEPPKPITRAEDAPEVAQILAATPTLKAPAVSAGAWDNRNTHTP